MILLYSNILKKRSCYKTASLENYFVTASLEEYLKNSHDHKEIEMIKKILKINPKIGQRDQLLKEIQQLFMKSQQLNDNTIEKLRKCGICLEKSNGKHIDGCFFDDSRYTLTVSSTPSDVYYNKQSIRYIKKFFF